MENENIKFEKLKLHFIYLVSFLVLSIIVVASGLWTEKNNFTEFLANAATMISIVLGLVAIFYSFYSNSSLSQSLGNISKVSDEVVQAKTQLGEFLKESDKLTKVGNSNTELLNEVSISVSNHVQSLNEALGQIAAHTEKLHETVTAIPQRLDQLENKVIEATNEGIAKINAVPKGAEKAAGSAAVPFSPSQFIEHSSVSGILLIYACLLAYKSKKVLSLPDLQAKLNFSTKEYLHGFYVGIWAANYVDSSDVKDKAQTYKITWIAPELESILKDQLISRINKNFKVESTRTEWLGKIDTLERVYS